MNTSRARKKEFNKIYRESILPNIQDFEEIRKKVQKNCIYLQSLCIILSLIILFCPFSLNLYKSTINYYYHYSPYNQWELGFFISIYIMILILLIGLFIGRIIIRNKSELILKISMSKKEIYDELLKPFGNIKWHKHDVTMGNTQKEKLSTEEIKYSRLFINYDTRFTDDEFTGVYKDVSFTISETKMLNMPYEKYEYKQYVEQGKITPDFYSFEGILVSFRLNKTARNRTIVATKKDFTAKNQAVYSALMAPLIVLGFFRPPRHADSETLKIYGIIILIAMIIAVCYTYYKEKQKEKKEEPMDMVILEDPIFGKRFKVYSSDQVEARYLVTPAFMERLYNLKTAFGSKNVKCSFYADTLMVSIATKKDLFEICSLYKPTKEVIYDFYKELNSIYEMIDYFKLYENIYLAKYN